MYRTLSSSYRFSFVGVTANRIALSRFESIVALSRHLFTGAVDDVGRFGVAGRFHIAVLLIPIWVLVCHSSTPRARRSNSGTARFGWAVHRSWLLFQSECDERSVFTTTRCDDHNLPALGVQVRHRRGRRLPR